jgi:5'-phosphate synthase pdxT subunit
MTSSAQIGVLDLQGGVQEHLEHLRRLGVAGKPVKDADDFNHLAGLIIPGGESTCLARLLTLFDLKEVIEREFQRGLMLWGTCAGAILLATENLGESPYFGLIDVTVKRNAFGSQLASFQCEASVPRIAAGSVPLTFIRAPKITRAGADVQILLQLDDYIAAAENDRVLVTVFHPELTPSLAFHRYFARKCGLLATADADREAPEPQEPIWSDKSWMQFPRKNAVTEG